MRGLEKEACHRSECTSVPTVSLLSLFIAGCPGLTLGSRRAGAHRAPARLHSLPAHRSIHRLIGLACSHKFSMAFHAACRTALLPLLLWAVLAEAQAVMARSRAGIVHSSNPAALWAMHAPLHAHPSCGRGGQLTNCARACAGPKEASAATRNIKQGARP